MNNYPQHRLLCFKTLVCAAALLGGPAWAGTEPVDDALPLVGTAGHGHTYPGATVPFGFVQLSPDTRTEGWDACSGYHYSDSKILGFSHTHLSGTGCGDLGDLLVTPFVGDLSQTGPSGAWDSASIRSPFAHENETAQPGYYRVLLDRNNITAELTATAHAGFHRYTFPASPRSHIALDLAYGLGSKTLDGALQIENKTTLTGYRHSGGWANDKTVYFVVESSQPFAGTTLEIDGKVLPSEQTAAKGKNVRGRLDYKTSAKRPVMLRVGLSATSIEGARKNLRAEIPTWDFEVCRNAARSAWNDALSRVRIESSDRNIRQTFYSALYHAMTAPTLYNDADGSYTGPDRKVHPGAGFQYYCTFSLWDTFRAEHPLMTLVQPHRVNDFVNSILAFYQQSPAHALPMWPLDSCETWCMIGYHSVPVIVDAYAKGFRGYDVGLAYEAMRNTAMNARNHQDEYQKLGFVPAETGKRNEATSRTLEFSFDDWCLAQMAKALGKAEDAEMFGKRSENFKNVFDPATGFFRGKTAAGPFREPFDPKAVSFDDYTEANAWQYAFAVMHDIPGMVQLYGGKEVFVHKLDQLFSEDSAVGNYLVDVSGLIGQYAHGNEPCHQVSYLYTLAGAPYKTAQRVRDIMFTQYSNTPDGICGNDDCGQISAWYVFSALGFYPVNPASGVYVFGSPLVEKATIQLDPKFYKGGSFTVVAHNVSRQNGYIKSAKLNGRTLDRPWITHAELVQGGTLEFEMDIQPNKDWGASVGQLGMK